MWANEPALKLHTVYTDQETHAQAALHHKTEHYKEIMIEKKKYIYIPNYFSSEKNVFNFVQYFFL